MAIEVFGLGVIAKLSGLGENLRGLLGNFFMKGFYDNFDKYFL